MNSKVLFTLSLVVIFIGAYGILHKPSEKMVPTTLQQSKPAASEKFVKVAVATKNINSLHLLKGDDYEIRMEKMASDLESKYVMKEQSYNGFLAKNKIQSGEYISGESVYSPGDPEFFRQNFRGGNLPYYYPVDKKNEYILSVIDPGENISVLLKYKKTSRKMFSAITSSETGVRLKNNERMDILIKPVMNHIPVIAVNYPKKGQALTLTEPTAEGHPVATVVLRLTPDQFVKMNLLKEAGDILLSPETSGDFLSGNNLDMILPEWDNQIREIRGHK
ncbi:hypothetical protein DO628_22555 [Salmonella enterica subsp. salamae]|nr:hypothetical protein [Salmonella enterica subsp. salamae serovar Sofia]EBS4543931.1 hypothetical protein [Salmonella enterica subsp. salamae serovar Sofia]